MHRFSLKKFFNGRGVVTPQKETKDARQEISRKIYELLSHYATDRVYLQDLKLSVCEDIFGTDNLGHREFDEAIERLVTLNELVLDEQHGRVTVALSNEYFQKQTSDFNLDESLRTIIQKIILGA